MTSPTTDLRRFDPEAFPGWRGMIGMAALAALLFLFQWFLIGKIPSGVLGFEYLLLLVPLAAGICYLIWLNEKIWTVAALLAHLLYMVGMQQGITPQEVGFSVITHFGMGVWFAKEVVIGRRRIVESGFDQLLLSFVIVSTITTFISNRIFGGNLINFTREGLVTYDLLLYFPLKKMLGARRDVALMIGAFAVIGMSAGMYSVLTYRERLMTSVYQYQIESSRVFANETTAMLFMFMFATLFAYSRGVLARLATFLGMGMGALFLGVSFARGAIVTGLFGLFVLAVILPFKRGRRVLVALFGSIVAITGLLFLFMPALVGNFARAMEMRLATVAKAGRDLSFNARIVEARVILSHVAENPLLGHGYGVLFKFTDPIGNHTSYIGYIHNGYVRPLYKFGVPLAMLVYLLMFYPLIRLAMRHPNRRSDPYLWGVAAGASSYLIAIIVLNYTTEVFSVYWSVLNFTVVWAALDYVNRELKKREVLLLPAAASPSADSGEAGDPAPVDLLVPGAG